MAKFGPPLGVNAIGLASLQMNEDLKGKEKGIKSTEHVIGLLCMPINIPIHSVQKLTWEISFAKKRKRKNPGN